MKPPHSKLFSGSVRLLKKVFGSAADQVKRKGKGSARRGPDVRKRTSVEDAYTLIETGECGCIGEIYEAKPLGIRLYRQRSEQDNRVVSDIYSCSVPAGSRH
eukprot:scaffold35204_cov48-Phaeocystis_antarctica.AAC.2